MNLESLIKLNRTIRAIGFDDAPFKRGTREKVSVAGIICGGTRFEGMLWGELQGDGFDSTETLCDLLLNSKFLNQLHLVLIDGIGFGGFNLVDLPLLSARLQLPCVAVMRRYPNLQKIESAMQKLPNFEERKKLLKRAGEIHHYPPFFFQVCGEEPEIIAAALAKLTDRGKVPEALRLAHLIGAAVIKGESGNSA